VHPLDQCSLVIALEGLQKHAGCGSSVGKGQIDLGKRARTIMFGFTSTEEVEIGSMQDQHGSRVRQLPGSRRSVFLLLHGRKFAANRSILSSSMSSVGKHCMQHEIQVALSKRTQVDQGYIATRTDDQGIGQTEACVPQLACQLDACRAGNQQRIADRILSGESPHAFSGIESDTDKLDASHRIPVLQARKGRHFLPARWAPASPEIDDQRFPLPGGK
jgi:hypothetical protein